jgi:hypothetical protein
LLKYLNTLEGNGAQAVPVVLFGNRNYDEALKELRNLLELRGFQTVAAGAFVGEHAFSYTLGKGRPDYADLSVASEFARRIFAVLRTGQVISPVRRLRGTAGAITARDQEGYPIDIAWCPPRPGHCTECGTAPDLSDGLHRPADVRNFINICINCEPVSKMSRGGPNTTTKLLFLKHDWRRPTPKARPRIRLSARPGALSLVQFFPQYPGAPGSPSEVQSSSKRKRSAPDFWAGERFSSTHVSAGPGGRETAIAVVHNRYFVHRQPGDFVHCLKKPGFHK